MKQFVPFTAGDIEIRLALNRNELYEAMHLRYKELLLSYNENNKNELEILKDEYDEQADHLIAVDLNTKKIIGTYRFLRKDQLRQHQVFATEEEFNIEKIKEENIMEISRAVVSPEYRTGSTIILLLKGLVHYAYLHKVKYVFGTASFYGINPYKYSHALSYIYYNHLSPEPLRIKAVKDKGISLNIFPSEQTNPALAKKEMPALVKGYINVGTTFGEEVFIDEAFNSVDVFVLAEVEKINEKYISRFVKTS